MVVWCWRYYSVWCCGMVGGEVGIDVSWGTRWSYECEVGGVVARWVIDGRGGWGMDGSVYVVEVEVICQRSE